MHKQARCGGCKRVIHWAITEKGKKMPLDTVPVDPVKGAYWVDADNYAHPPHPMLDPIDVTYYMNHWTTCPKADDFKAKGKRR